VEQTKALLILGTFLAVLIAAGAGWTVRRDSAARDLAIKALREEKERFHAMANNISQLAWMADEKGSTFWYNQRWFDYTGTTLQEAAGWGWQKVHHPDHVESVVDKISRCFQNGEVWEDTFPLRGRDGEYRWFLSRAVPTFDAEGKLLRWFGTNTDITDRQQAEAKLELLTERLSLATAVAKVGVWDWDLVSTTSSWDATMFDIYGFTPAAALSYEKWAAAVHPEDLPAVEAVLQKSIAEKSGGSAEFRIILGDGSLRNISVIERVLLDEHGNVSRLIGVNIDITDRRNAEKVLEQSRFGEVTSQPAISDDPRHRGVRTPTSRKQEPCFKVWGQSFLAEAVE